MSATDLLDRIQIKEPCDSDWDSMIGNDQVRFCEHCSLTVRDLSQMTRKRARRLVAKSKGRLCVRYQRRPDGSLVTRAVPQKLFRIGRRASRIAAGAFSATLSLSTPVANASIERLTMTQGSVESRQDPSRQTYSRSAIVGEVTDSQGTAISGATVFLFRDEPSFSLITSTDSQGEFRFEGLEAGTYSLRFDASGFSPADSRGLYVTANSTERSNMRLQPEAAPQEERVERFATMGAVAMARVEPTEPLVKAAQDDEFLELLTVLTHKNVNVRDKATGTTALEHAVRNGNREMLQALISVGADVNIRNDSKETVLMMLGTEATADMVWDLIHAGAKLDLKDDDGDTALIEAAMVNNLSVLQALLQAGANANTKNDEGQTALMLAASNDMMKNVKALIAAGADMNARDNKGRTALDYAQDEGNEKVVKLLQAYGAVEGTPPEEK